MYKNIGFLVIVVIQVSLVLLVLDNLPKEPLRLIILFLINIASAIAINKLSKIKR